MAKQKTIRKAARAGGGATDAVAEARTEEPVAVKAEAAPDRGFGWYFHSASVNETAEALAVAEAKDAPVLLFVGRPGCAVCEAAWESIDAEGRLASRLKEAGVVGLKVEDSRAHYMALASLASTRENPDGSRPATTAPFMMLVRAQGSGASFGEADVARFLGGTSGRSMPTWTYENAAAWLTSTLAKGGKE